MIKRHKAKRKKGTAKTVEAVRRSSTLAELAAGFKDKDSAEAFANSHDALEAMDLGSKFDAVVMDSQQEAPPILPINTIQAIGTSFCKIPPKDVSDEDLNYDSSYDGV